MPLQPLSDNLESITYEVFERDPIKYEWYERAVCSALQDWVDQEKQTSSEDGKIVIAVVGAGRGPLVARALHAAEIVFLEVEVWAVEKNPNAYVLLQTRNREDWDNKVHVVKSDMRAWKGPLRPDGTHGKVDILVSELLGSFADNELSPECLDGVQHVLNAEFGISIPESYTAFLTPISTPRLFSELSTKGTAEQQPFEIPYVVMLHAFDFLSYEADEQPTMKSSVLEPPSDKDPTLHLKTPVVKPCWTFRHPQPNAILRQSSLRRGGSAEGGGGGTTGGEGANAHNTRFTQLSFACPKRGVCHGFAGYFETVLYASTALEEDSDDEPDIVELSTNPLTMDRKSKDMISWFPIYFPLKVVLSRRTKSCLQLIRSRSNFPITASCWLASGVKPMTARFGMSGWSSFLSISMTSSRE
jgi:protein arginine N-methyltransferase 5